MVSNMCRNTHAPMYLSDHIDTVRKRCLRTILPGHRDDDLNNVCESLCDLFIIAFI